MFLIIHAYVSLCICAFNNTCFSVTVYVFLIYMHQCTSCVLNKTCVSVTVFVFLIIHASVSLYTSKSRSPMASRLCFYQLIFIVSSIFCACSQVYKAADYRGWYRELNPWINHCLKAKKNISTADLIRNFIVSCTCCAYSLADKAPDYRGGDRGFNSHISHCQKAKHNIRSDDLLGKFIVSCAFCACSSADKAPDYRGVRKQNSNWSKAKKNIRSADLIGNFIVSCACCACSLADKAPDSRGGDHGFNPRITRWPRA